MGCEAPALSHRTVMDDVGITRGGRITQKHSAGIVNCILIGAARFRRIPAGGQQGSRRYWDSRTMVANAGFGNSLRTAPPV
jgi:hypothetical protein